MPPAGRELVGKGRRSAEHASLAGTLHQPSADIGPTAAVEEIRGLIQDYLSWEVVVNTAESVIQALETEVRHKISFWHALVLQAAESSGAGVLYSEDLATGRRYGAVEVINPLLG